MKNQKLLIGGAIALIAIVAIGFFIISGKKTSPPTQIPQTEDTVSTIPPEEIGLSLSTTSDNRKVILEISKTEGLSGIDYELSYTAKGDIPRGIIGHIDIKTPGKVITQEIVLGTCSDVCHYDEDVSNIKIVLKVAKTDGTVGQVEKSL